MTPEHPVKIGVITRLAREVDQVISDLEADVPWPERRQFLMDVDLPRLKAALDALPNPLPLHFEL